MGMDLTPGTFAPTVPNPHALQAAFLDQTCAIKPIKFGTSGHRGEVGQGFNLRHVRAIAQAVAAYRTTQGYEGYLLIGGDTRAVRELTSIAAAEVLASHGVKVMLMTQPMPTPVISTLVMRHPEISDAIIGTASHNPPAEMGIKYNPSHGGPADKDATGFIQDTANALLIDGRGSHHQPLASFSDQQVKIDPEGLDELYLDALEDALDTDAIKASGLTLKIHPLGGAALPFFEKLADRLGCLKLVDRTLDPTFQFIPLDHDGKIRMDPSSPFPMQPLLAAFSDDERELAGATDPDADRFGVATRLSGLLNPNHALCVAADYLLRERPDWSDQLTLGRTIGTTHLLDRIAAAHGRPAPDETDVGFKNFVAGQVAGKYALMGEESAGLSFHKWTTEKDGIAAVMLFAEIMAKTGKDLAALYRELTEQHGEPAYARADTPATDEIMLLVRSLTRDDIDQRLRQVDHRLAGKKVVKVRTTDGVKLYLQDDEAWVLVRPSGTEPIVKFYTESFLGESHRRQVEREARALFGLG